MKRCICGELVEDHVSFHWTGKGDNDGHYVTDEAFRAREEGEGPPADWPVRFQRAFDLWGDPPHRCRAPGLPVPPRASWTSEELLRKSSNQLLEAKGFAVYDLEQGYREDGSSRVGEGIGDTFVTRAPELCAWLEYKRWDNEPRPDQYLFGRRVLSAGGIYLLVYELAQVQRWLEEVSS